MELSAGAQVALLRALQERRFERVGGAETVAVDVRVALLDLPFNDAVAALERELIRRALEASSGNRTEAARRLQINRRLLYSKMRDHGLE